MSYNPTDADLRAVQQKTKDIYVKIELLNRNYKIIDSLTGNLINDDLSIDSSSKQHRTYNCTLYVSDCSFTIGEDKKIWIDKYVRVYYGIKQLRGDNVLWWLIGTFTYSDANYTYSATDNSLSLSCVDLMADYDGTKNGIIGGYSLTIPAGEDIRQSIIALVKQAGITKYKIEDIKKEIPYDLEYSDSTTYCDVWTDICELYDSWEFFFDEEGTFIWRQIPTGNSEPVSLDDSILEPLIISESSNNTFTGIYNVTEIWGKVIELEHDDRYANTSTFANGIYSITLPGITSLDDIDNLDQIGIRICSNSVAGASVSINGLAALPIVNDDGTAVATDRLKADTDYVFSYRRALNGEIKNRLNYEKLYSDDLCYNQAEYLTYQSTAMRDTINLTMIIIPWLDVNQKIEYTPKTSGVTGQYLVQSISWSTLEGTMNVTLYKFLESFSYVKNKENQSERRMI